MAEFKRFEDLIAWQKARQLTKDIYILTGKGDFARDFGLSNQIQRAAVSVMSNIAEGFERESSNEFSRFLIIAKASCGEVRSQLYVANDVGYITDNELDQLKKQTEEISRIIAGLIKSVRVRK